MVRSVFIRILLVYIATELMLEDCWSAMKVIPSPSKKRREETKSLCALASKVLIMLIFAFCIVAELVTRLRVKIVLATIELALRVLVLSVNALSVLKDVLIKKVDVLALFTIVRRLVTLEPNQPAKVLVLYRLFVLIENEL